MKPSRSTVPCIPLGSLNWVPALIGWGKGKNVTSAGWQVTLCVSPYDMWVPVAVRIYLLTAVLRLLYFLHYNCLRWDWVRASRELQSGALRPLEFCCSVYMWLCTVLDADRASDRWHRQGHRSSWTCYWYQMEPIQRQRHCVGFWWCYGMFTVIDITWRTSVTFVYEPESSKQHVLLKIPEIWNLKFVLEVVEIFPEFICSFYWLLPYGCNGMTAKASGHKNLAPVYLLRKQ